MAIKRYIAFDLVQMMSVQHLLNVRSTNILKKTYVESIEELMTLDYDAWKKYVNCGDKTAKDLVVFLSKLRLHLSDHFSKEYTNPVLDNQTIRTVKPTDPVELLELLDNIKLSYKSRMVLKRLNVVTIKEFLVLDLFDILKIEKLGHCTIYEICTAIEQCKKNEKLQELANSNKIVSLEQSKQSIDVLNLSVRATNVLSKINILTVGELSEIPFFKLSKLRNCGFTTVREIYEKLTTFYSKDFVIWTQSSAQPNGLLNPEITNIVNKLSNNSFAKCLNSGDHRYGYLITRLNLNVNSFEEAAMILGRLTCNPLNPDTLLTILCEVENVVLKHSAFTLEEELEHYISNISGSRNKQIVQAYFDLSGEGMKTLEEVGRLFNVSRERIRQITKFFSINAKPQTYLPVLDSILKFISVEAPVSATKFERSLVLNNLTRNIFLSESILNLAYVFGRKASYKVINWLGVRYLVQTNNTDCIPFLDSASQ